MQNIHKFVFGSLFYQIKIERKYFDVFYEAVYVYNITFQC